MGTPEINNFIHVCEYYIKCISYKKNVSIHTHECRIQQKQPLVSLNKTRHLQHHVIHYFCNIV